MNCIIIEDDQFYIDFIVEYCKKLNIQVNNIYKDSVIAFQEIDKIADTDVIFLDIHMPDISGFDILKNLLNCQVVIVSADDQNAIKAFDFSVTDYLQKPFTFERFLRAVNKVKEKLNIQQVKEEVKEIDEPIRSVFFPKSSGSIYVNINKKLVKIIIEDINIVEAKGDYVLIKLESGGNLIVHSTLKKINDKLPDDIFVQVHRSFVINIKKIVDIEESTIVVNRDVIPISRGNKSTLLQKLNIIS
ncbi:MAG: LytTR family DNA-binding domain-containing protein [Flavobacteriaceae bacterium]|nr:LytTR family DNA-binding domain-containing protein [Flavobacteriaceae bacterium]